MSSAYGWRGVEQVELDRILAAGPTVVCLDLNLFRLFLSHLGSSHHAWSS